MDVWEACRCIGRRLGLPVDELRTLSDRGNRIIHFSPAPVVARVCTLTAFTRRDPFAWLARELAVAQFAAAQGGHVLKPTENMDPGPYTINGIHLSLWQYAEVEPQTPTAEEVGVSLAALHECLRTYPGELAVLTPAADQIRDGLHALEGHGAPPELRELSELHRRYLAEIGGLDNDFVLHGDAHPGNLLRVGGQWMWADFEETCRGPVHWDLAILQRSTRLDGSAAVRAYCRATRLTVPGPAVLRPLMRLRDLEAAVWAAGLAVQDERYVPTARGLMKQALRPDESLS